MDVFGIINFAIFVGMGLLILIHVSQKWDDEKSQPYRYSEIIYGILFCVMGYYLLIYLDVEEISRNAAYKVNLTNMIIYGATLAWLEFLNVNPRRQYFKKHPEELKEYNYEEYLASLKDSYVKKDDSKDIIKDLSRKALHMLVLAIIFGMPAIAQAKSVQPNLVKWGLSQRALYQTLYLESAGFFLLMFTYADYWRLTEFGYLPKWAKGWYFKSVDFKTESYTFISSVPFLLALIACLFHPDIIVIYSAAIISCVSDSVASVVGKSMGRRKLTHFGLFPEKTVEGLIAGALSAYIGVLFVFHYFNPTTNFIVDNIFAISGALIFIMVDAYGKKIADNILNTLIPAGVFTVLLIFL